MKYTQRDNTLIIEKTWRDQICNALGDLQYHVDIEILIDKNKAIIRYEDPITERCIKAKLANTLFSFNIFYENKILSEKTMFSFVIDVFKEFLI